MFRPYALAIACLLVTSVSPLWAVLEVGAGKPYPTITAALAVAVNGDTVLVHPGIYAVYPGTPETILDFNNRSIVVTSTNPTDPATVAATIIELGTTGTYQTCRSLFRFSGSEGRDSKVRGFTLRNAFDWYFGSAFRLEEGASPTIEYCVIKDGKCGWGGYGGRGAGIWTKGGNPLIQHNTFTNNEAESNGGGIYIDKGSAVIRNNTFTGNRCQGSGIYADLRASDVLRVEDNTFTGNYMTSLYSVGGTQIIRGNAIKTTQATDASGTNGQGVVVSVASSARLEGNTVAGNASVGIALDRTPGIVIGNVIRGNATGFSGASGGTLADNTFRGNTRYLGASLSGGTWTVRNNLFVENTSTGSYYNAMGGGLHVRNVTATLTGNTFRGNRACYGGGLYSSDSTVTLSNSVISHNRAVPYESSIGGNGGGIYLDGGSLTVNHCTIALNSASAKAGYAGGICVADGQLRISNSLVTHSKGGGGIAGPFQSIRYCNVYGNAGGDYVGQTDLTGTAGNIRVDPLYFRPSDYDFHPRSQYGRYTTAKGWANDPVTSPCVNAGDPAAPFVLEPAPNGGRVNMGAYGNTAQASKSPGLAPRLTWCGASGYEADGVGPDVDAPGADFNFRIKYQSPSGTAAQWVRLHVNTPGGTPLEGSPFTMNTAQSTWKTGVVFKKIVRLRAHGRHKYWFEASDGTAKVLLPATGGLAGPDVDRPQVLGWAGGAGYVKDGVSPDTGAAESNFVFKVKYQDPDGDPARLVQVYVYSRFTGSQVDGSPFSMTKVTHAVDDWRAGVIYQASLQLDEPDAYKYTFWSESAYQSRRFPTDFAIGPGVGTAGKLSWAGLPGYTTDGFQPNTAALKEDVVFRVKWKDADGAPPVAARLRLWMPDGSPVASPFNMNIDWAQGWDVTEGIVLICTVTFNATGTYKYQFEADDGFPLNKWPTPDPGSGPTITTAASGTLVVSGASAQQVGPGAQLTYTLAAPGDVLVEVLNLAGRLVAEIPAGKQEAGVQSLSWSGRSRSGSLVPNGSYLLRLRVCRADGSQASALCPLQLRR